MPDQTERYSVMDFERDLNLYHGLVTQLGRGENPLLRPVELADHNGTYIPRLVPDIDGSLNADTFDLAVTRLHDRALDLQAMLTDSTGSEFGSRLAEQQLRGPLIARLLSELYRTAVNSYPDMPGYQENTRCRTLLEIYTNHRVNQEKALVEYVGHRAVNGHEITCAVSPNRFFGYRGNTDGTEMTTPPIS